MTKIKELKKVFNWNFSLLFFGNATSKLGSVVYNIVLVWWIVQETDSTRLLGYITAAGMIPVVIFNVFSGVIVDRLNRKRLLVVTDILSGIACIMVSVIAYKNIINVPILIIASFILGTCNSLFSPTVKAILPEITDRNLISKCNSINTTVSQLIKVSGPIIGGILMGNYALGIAGAFFINGISYFVSAISEMLMKYKMAERENKELTYFDDLKKGFAYFKEHGWLFKLLISCAIANFFLASHNLLMPLFLKTIYSDTGSIYSRVLSIEAIGGIIGSMSIGLFKKKTDINTLGKELVLLGVSVAIIQVFKSTYLVYFGVLFYGMFGVRFNVLFFSLVQMNVKKQMLGRVFSLIITIAVIAAPLSNLVFGFIGEYIINYAFIVLGIGIVIASVVIFIISADQHPSELSEEYS